MRRRNPIDSNSLIKMGLILGGAYVAYKYILPMIQGSATTVQSVVAPTMIASAPAPAPGMNAPVMLPAIAPPPAGGLTAPVNYGINPGYTDPVTGMIYPPTYITQNPNAPASAPTTFMPVVQSVVPAKAGLQSSNGMMNTFNNPNLPS